MFVLIDFINKNFQERGDVRLGKDLNHFAGQYLYFFSIPYPGFSGATVNLTFKNPITQDSFTNSYIGHIYQGGFYSLSARVIVRQASFENFLQTEIYNPLYQLLTFIKENEICWSHYTDYYNNHCNRFRFKSPII